MPSTTQVLARKGSIFSRAEMIVDVILWNELFNLANLSFGNSHLGILISQIGMPQCHTDVKEVGIISEN